MGDKTGIAWTDATWNPVTGCTKVSAGCKHCYAERVFPRAYAGQTVPQSVPGTDGWIERPRRFTDVMTHPDRLDQPLRWRKPRRVFVNSMSDLFHDDVPVEFVAQVFAVMALAPHHTFQILTKRPERMQSLLSDDDFWFSVEDYASDFARRPISVESPITSVWLGVSVEDQATADQRIPLLLETPAALRFVSYEPALGPVDFSAHGAHALPDHHPSGDGRGGWWSDLGNLPGEPHVDWIIVGGESGPNARTFDVQWARDTITQCRGAGVTVFVKQLGANPVVWFFGSDLPINLKHRAGADPSEWPEYLRVQEWPA